MNHDKKNFVLAIVLSALIIIGWTYLFPNSMLTRQPAEPPATIAPETATTAAGTGAASGQSSAGTASVAGPIAREDALKASPRVAINSASLAGSINLTGAQIDDLHLTKYRETIDPGSPTIVFLSPSGTQGALFAEQGLVAATGTTAKLPTAETLWSAPQGAALSENSPVVLTWDNGEGLFFTRKIEIADEYLFSISQSIENRSGSAVALLPYGRIVRQDMPHVAGWYVFFEGMLGWINGGLQEVHYSDLAEGSGPTAMDSVGGWLGFTDKYWAAALIPDQSAAVAATFQHYKAGARDVFQADYLAKNAIVIQPGQSASHQERLFAGAKVVRTVNNVGSKYGVAGFDYMIDWGWFYFLTKPFFFLLDWLNGLVGNFGIAILLATVLVKAAVFPLANKSYASMSKMKKLQPEMERLKQQYPDDRMKMQQELMELYKREKVSPVSGCLPVLVQIPIFFALYKVILTSIELRHAPFFGWIQDLSAADPTSLFNLFGLIPWTPPHMLAIGVWPLLMGITMWVQMRLNPTPPDPVQASLFNWMPVIFTFMLGTFPAGLVIYWAWSNLLSILQQSIIMKRHGVEVNLLGNIRSSLSFPKKTPTR